MFIKLLNQELDKHVFDTRVREICQIEPRIQAVLERAIFSEITPQYDRIRSYHALRGELDPLLGWHAEHPALRNSGDYQLILETLIDLLPPDDIEDAAEFGVFERTKAPLPFIHPPFP